MSRLHNSLFLALLCMLSFSPVHSSTCTEPIIIDTVKIKELIPVYEALRECAQTQGTAIAYVFGIGGPLDEALAFFDLVRTTPGLASKLTFIATSDIASASNIVWLAADTRVALPGNRFIIHEATWNMTEESLRVRQQHAKIAIDATERAVRFAANEAAAHMWKDILSGDEQGRVLSAEEALEIGWATEIRAYAE